MTQHKNITTSEELFTMLQNKQIEPIMRALFEMNRANKKDLSDIKTFITTFDQCFQHLVKDYEVNELEPIMLANAQLKILSEANTVFLYERLFEMQEDSKAKYDIAKMLPNHPIFEEYIIEYTKNESVEVSHSLEDRVRVGETNYTERKEDFRIGLFKSKQEKTFFSAARSVFPNCFVCPNVAISCVINADMIMGYLDDEEKKYFFKGIVDCVIFENVYNEGDEFANFKPLYFVELDSVFHDAKNQKINDKLKDSIFGKAGLQLIRIRPKGDKSALSVADYERILIEKRDLDFSTDVD